MSPSVWKQFADSLCLQCFVFRLIFPLVTDHPLSSRNYKDCGNLTEPFFHPPNTGCCACCAYFVVYDTVCVSDVLSMRRLRDELVQLVGVVCPHLALALLTVFLLFQVMMTKGGRERWAKRNI